LLPNYHNIGLRPKYTQWLRRDAKADSGIND